MSRFLMIATLLAACAGTAPPPAPPLKNTVADGVGPPVPHAMAGSYRAPHTIMVVCSENDDGWCEEDVEDVMEVRDQGEGKLDVSIELVQTNGHTCTFEDVLVKEPAARRWTFTQPDEPEGPCTLALAQGEHEVTLQADGCRYYCGARASLDATFPFPAR